MTLKTEEEALRRAHAARRTVSAAEAAYQKAAARAEELRLARNAAIRDAATAGLRTVAIAEATGLGRSRITQILRG